MAKISIKSLDVNRAEESLKRLLRTVRCNRFSDLKLINF